MQTDQFVQSESTGDAPQYQQEPLLQRQQESRAHAVADAPSPKPVELKPLALVAARARETVEATLDTLDTITRQLEAVRRWPEGSALGTLNTTLLSDDHLRWLASGTFPVSYNGALVPDDVRACCTALFRLAEICKRSSSLIAGVCDVGDSGDAIGQSAASDDELRLEQRWRAHVAHELGMVRSLNATLRDKRICNLQLLRGVNPIAWPSDSAWPAFVRCQNTGANGARRVSIHMDDLAACSVVRHGAEMRQLHLVPLPIGEPGIGKMIDGGRPYVVRRLCATLTTAGLVPTPPLVLLLRASPSTYLRDRIVKLTKDLNADAARITSGPNRLAKQAKLNEGLAELDKGLKVAEREIRAAGELDPTLPARMLTSKVIELYLTTLYVHEQLLAGSDVGQVAPEKARARSEQQEENQRHGERMEQLVTRVQEHMRTDAEFECLRLRYGAYDATREDQRAAARALECIIEVHTLEYIDLLEARLITLAALPTRVRRHFQSATRVRDLRSVAESSVGLDDTSLTVSEIRSRRAAQRNLCELRNEIFRVRVAPTDTPAPEIFPIGEIYGADDAVVCGTVERAALVTGIAAVGEPASVSKNARRKVHRAAQQHTRPKLLRRDRAERDAQYWHMAVWIYEKDAEGEAEAEEAAASAKDVGSETKARKGAAAYTREARAAAEAAADTRPTWREMLDKCTTEFGETTLD